MAGKPLTQSELDVLHRMAMAGHGPKTIAEELGRARGTISARMTREGIGKGKSDESVRVVRDPSGLLDGAVFRLIDLVYSVRESGLSDGFAIEVRGVDEVWTAEMIRGVMVRDDGMILKPRYNGTCEWIESKESINETQATNEV